MIAPQEWKHEWQEEIVTYPGKEADVQWDGRLCIHVAECGRAKGEFFVGGWKSWCKPDVSAYEDVLDVVKRCPTGALTLEVKEGEQEETAEK